MAMSKRPRDFGSRHMQGCSSASRRLTWCTSSGAHSAADGVPLILVEVKDSSQLPDAGTGQAKSYAYWIKPAYYVITNGEVLIVYNYQGGAVPDVKVLEMKRSELQQRFDELYSILNPAAATEARRLKEAKFAGPPPSRPE